MMKVGFIGLGAMGSGMASNLAKAGLLTHIYNRTKSKANALSIELNVTACDSIQQLAVQVDIIFICVSADNDVLEVIKAIVETAQPDSIVVDMSTVSNETAKLAAAILAKNKIEFLDSPVSGGVEGAKKGTLAIMAGGNQYILKKVSPALEAMSSHIIHMGKIGNGQSTKAVNQIMAAGINQAVTEALAFGQAQGLAIDQVVEIISAGAAGNWFLQHRGISMTNKVFEPGFKLALHHKDLKICQTMAQQVGSSIQLADKTVLDYEQLMEQGLGDEDISTLYRLKTDTQD